MFLLKGDANHIWLRDIIKRGKDSIPIINITIGQEIKSDLIIPTSILLEEIKPKLEQLLAIMSFAPYLDDQVAEAEQHAKNLFALALHYQN